MTRRQTPRSRTHEAETYRLTGRLVIIVPALHRSRDDIAASVQNGATTIAKEHRVRQRKACQASGNLRLRQDRISVLACIWISGRMQRSWPRQTVIICLGLCWNENSSMAFCCFEMGRQAGIDRYRYSLLNSENAKIRPMVIKCHGKVSRKEEKGGPRM